MLSHSLHIFKPLNVTFCRPPKPALYRECAVYVDHAHDDDPYDIAGVYNSAFFRADLIEKGISGFKVAGIYLLNHNTLSAYFLAPAMLQNNNEKTSATEKSNNDDQ
jgi:hypothetical protein